jgi:hypothetical protein
MRLPSEREPSSHDVNVQVEMSPPQTNSTAGTDKLPEPQPLAGALPCDGTALKPLPKADAIRDSKAVA